jgi:hypothetical protein
MQPVFAAIVGSHAHNDGHPPFAVLVGRSNQFDAGELYRIAIGIHHAPAYRANGSHA